MIFDVTIIGAGSMGMAAGYYLALKGKKVLMLDANRPPHTEGSHHGETRIIRYAYGEGEQYVPLALRAKNLWQSLEQSSGQTLLLQTGVLNLGPVDALFMQTILDSARCYDLPIQKLNAWQVNKRYAGIRLPHHYFGCLEKDAGVLMCHQAIEAYREQALAYGATLLDYHHVTAISPQEKHIEVTANDKTFQSRKLIVCAGANSQALLTMLGLKLPIQPTRKTFAWYDVQGTNYDSQNFPAFSLTTDQGVYYGFPNIDGAGFKIGRHDLGQNQDPSQAIPPFNQAVDTFDLNKVIQQYFPQVGKFKLGKTCLYSVTPDEHFIIDKHPTNPNIVIAAGFSGHGFKFASAIGEALADLTTHGEPQFDLTPFALSRFKRNLAQSA
ncbi:MAG: N-methyl-L-tryptophan oxidase [Vibrio sp.]